MFGIHQGRIFAETNMVVSEMEEKVFQVERTQIILRQRYKGELWKQVKQKICREYKQRCLVIAAKLGD
jgi:hypothetical protein